MTSWSSDRHHYLGSFNKGYPSMWCWRHREMNVSIRQTQNIWITFAQRLRRWSSIVQILYKLLTGYLAACLHQISITAGSVLATCVAGRLSIFTYWMAKLHFNMPWYVSVIKSCCVCGGGGEEGGGGRAQPLVGIETGHDTGPLRADID